MRFKKAFVVFLMVCGFFAAAEVFLVLSPSQLDEELYLSLNASSPAQAHKESYSANQNRTGSNKTILMSDGDVRKLGMVKCNASQLTFNHEDSFHELVENMQGVSITFQEDLLYDQEGSPYQIVVVLEAQMATYYYKQQKWVAENVAIQRYRLPGHELPPEMKQAAFFQGTADKMAFNFKDKMQQLHTYGLNATYSQEDTGERVCSKRIY